MAKSPLGPAGTLGDALTHLAKTIDSRAGGDASISYTAKLLSKPPGKAATKIVEEAGELAVAIVSEGRAETASEAADLIYHMLVGLRAKGVALDAVAKALIERRGVSGLDEKANR